MAQTSATRSFHSSYGSKFDAGSFRNSRQKGRSRMRTLLHRERPLSPYIYSQDQRPRHPRSIPNIGRLDRRKQPRSFGNSPPESENKLHPACHETFFRLHNYQADPFNQIPLKCLEDALISAVFSCPLCVLLISKIRSFLCKNNCILDGGEPQAPAALQSPRTPRT